VTVVVAVFMRSSQTFILVLTVVVLTENAVESYWLRFGLALYACSFLNPRVATFLPNSRIPCAAYVWTLDPDHQEAT
jgi:hypothetical protein